MLPNLPELLSFGTILGLLTNPLATLRGSDRQQQQQQQQQNALATAGASGVSLPFFASLERTSRLVDITYCVGTAGVSPPFSCPSRCADFPTLHLLQTWHTGLLLSDSCGYIAVDHGDDPAIIVAFRGTYSLTNTVVDLSTVPQAYVPYPSPDDDDQLDTCANCTVHAGFLASWRNAREMVLPALRTARAMHPRHPVHLVGHSLGGAVAALAALELRLALRWPDMRVTTFGEPRVGNAALADYMDRAFGLAGNGPAGEGRLYRRVTHRGDPVPLLPLAEWGYRPHAGEVFIAKADLQPSPADLRLCRGGSDPECSGGAEVGGRRRWGGLVDSLVRTLRRQDEDEGEEDDGDGARDTGLVPVRFRLWQLLFAHRDYFWRLGLCVPGGDPTDWGRKKYKVDWPRPGQPGREGVSTGDEL
ncbi:hypothetical protein P8C59_004059 [Phyllachora maydis]|uniref:Fungal lipase-type domain-containing protein n=1 Tax=Phyllachora maydis TaxID=1825666 RepID=A0AAD9M9Y9_9PEZI|nr:hypothetical protein P8C59_004059 [Phyllachora maydis]